MIIIQPPYVVEILYISMMFGNKILKALFVKTNEKAPIRIANNTLCLLTLLIWNRRSIFIYLSTLKLNLYTNKTFDHQNTHQLFYSLCLIVFLQHKHDPVFMLLKTVIDNYSQLCHKFTLLKMILIVNDVLYK